MAIPIIIRWHETGPPVIPRRSLNRVLRLAYDSIGKRWHTEFRPIHFTRRAIGRYGYTPRKGDTGSGRAFRGSYTAQKLRKFKHTLPLVWSGDSRLLSRLRDVRSTAKGARVVMRVPTLNLRPATGTINMREELATITQPEAAALATTFAAVMERSIGKIRTRRTLKL